MRTLAISALVFIALCFTQCSAPVADPCIAVSSAINSQYQGDYMLVASIVNKEGACIEGKPSRACNYEVTFEVRVRVPGSANQYQPASNFPEVVDALETSGKRLVWSGGEMRGQNGKKGAPLILERTKAFKQTANTGRAYTLHVSSAKPVELFPMTEGKSAMGKLELQTRVALQCADCDGELPPVVEAGQFSSWW